MATSTIVVGGTGLYLTALIDELVFPGEWPEIRAELEAETNTSDLFVRLTELDPVAASRTEPNNRRRIVRALEVCLGSGERFSGCEFVAAFELIVEEMNGPVRSHGQTGPQNASRVLSANRYDDDFPAVLFLQPQPFLERVGVGLVELPRRVRVTHPGLVVIDAHLPFARHHLFDADCNLHKEGDVPRSTSKVQGHLLS